VEPPADPPPPPFRDEAVVFDIVFVLHASARGWILEKICRVVAEASGALCHFLFVERNERADFDPPAARSYFFAHFVLAHHFLARYPVVRAGNVFVWVTHLFLGSRLTRDDLVAIGRRSTHLFTPNTRNREELAAWGVDRKAISVPIGGADPALFRPKRRTGTGAIGFVGAYYPRKQPDRMLAIARLMPEVPVILLGPAAGGLANEAMAWEAWPGLPEFLALPNVRYVAADYADYPAWYREMDVFCSVSGLEGGPIPAIEAMMSNLVPVLSDTGFARDILKPGAGGAIFDPAAPAEAIVPLLRAALADTTSDLAAQAAGFTWAAFGEAIWRRMRGDLPPGRSVNLARQSNAARYLRRGFQPVSSTGAAMRARDAEIEIPLARGTRPRGIELQGWAPPVPGGARIGLRFAIDGQEVASASVTEKAGTVQLPVPAGPAGGTLRLSIRADSLFQADRVWGPKHGTRKLSAKFAWFRLMEEAPALAAPAIAARGRGRVLLLGAYANGNIGDTYQALALMRHAEACRPDLDLFATSLSRKPKPYDFPADRLFEGGLHATNPEGMNAFDALVIGGGGLLAATHAPLDNPAWAARLTLPVLILANGATAAVAKPSAALIRQARHVSGRDEYSVRALRHFRQEVSLLNDPILADPSIGPWRGPRGRGLCVIPRKMGAYNRADYERLAALMTADDLVLSMFPIMDGHTGALRTFEPHRQVLAQDMATMVDTLAGAGFVVSERYHGCILALKLGVPCLGLFKPEEEETKIVGLYRQLGIEHLLLDPRREDLSRETILRLLADFDPAPIQARIAAITDAFRAGLVAALDGIV
jgi:glycosyltransferase involved in cell wall biosynthesis